MLDLEEMIWDGTGLNALTYLNGYGCYCGWGGDGRPMDGIDRYVFIALQVSFNIMTYVNGYGCYCG